MENSGDHVSQHAPKHSASSRIVKLQSKRDRMKNDDDLIDIMRASFEEVK